MSKSTIQILKISELQPNPFQPRDKIQPESIEELAASITTYGILEPLVVAHTPAGYQIIAGERRWRAAQLAKLEEVPVYIKKSTPRGMLEMALVENVQRTDLSPLERAKAFQQLLRDFTFIPNTLAKAIGKSASYITNTLRLLKLPDALSDGLIGNQISEGHARALLGMPDENSMVEMYKLTLKKGFSVRQVEDMVRQFKHKTEGGPKQSSKNLMDMNSKEVEEWSKNVQKFFNVESKFKLVRSQRRTNITISLMGQPEQTQKDLLRIMNLLAK